MDWIMFRSATSFISRLFSFLYGTLTPLITLLLFVVTVADFVYLLIPTATTLMNKTFDGTRFGGFHLMSHDAIKARELGFERMEPGIWIYLGLRLKTYTWTVVIFYFILGGGPIVIETLLNYVSMVLESM